jgi:small subunit ribosomal protein S7
MLITTGVPNQKILEFLTHSIMKKGKKHTAETIVRKLARILKQDYKKALLPVLIQALENTKPLIGFRNVRLRGSSYKIPYFLKEQEQIKVALGWFLTAARNSNSSVANSLAKEFIQASLKQGDLVKRRDEIHKLANQNKVFAHYRWF